MEPAHRSHSSGGQSAEFVLWDTQLCGTSQMQSMAKETANVNRPAKLTIMNTLTFIYKENGIKGLYRGVTPRIGLGIWQTICMVSFTDYVKLWFVPRYLCILMT